MSKKPHKLLRFELTPREIENDCIDKSRDYEKNRWIYTKICVICKKEYKTYKFSNNDSKTCKTKECSHKLRSTNSTKANSNPETKLKVKNKWKSKSRDEIDEIVKSREKTLLTKYGVTNPMRLDSVKKKIFTEEFRKKQRKTALERLKKLQESGIYHNLQPHIKNFENLNKIFILEKFGENGIIPMKNRLRILEYFNMRTNAPSNIIKIFNKLDIPYEKGELTGTSLPEIELRELIQNNFKDLKIIPNARILLNEKTNSLRELDIFIPELKIGIEYNSLYYHGSKNNERDDWKRKKCKEMNITLFEVWDDENITSQINKIVYYIKSRLK